MDKEYNYFSEGTFNSAEDKRLNIFEKVNLMLGALFPGVSVNYNISKKIPAKNKQELYFKIENIFSDILLLLEIYSEIKSKNLDSSLKNDIYNYLKNLKTREDFGKIKEEVATFHKLYVQLLNNSEKVKVLPDLTKSVQEEVNETTKVSDKILILLDEIDTIESILGDLGEKFKKNKQFIENSSEFDDENTDSFNFIFDFTNLLEEIIRNAVQLEGDIKLHYCKNRDQKEALLQKCMAIAEYIKMFDTEESLTVYNKKVLVWMSELATSVEKILKTENDKKN